MLSTHRITSRRQPPAFNMTSMIDVVFLLLIFFALVTRFSSAENVPLEVPKPEHSQAQDVQLKDRVVINCRWADPVHSEMGVVYSAGPHPPEELERISARLAAAKQTVPELKVVIRADRHLPFSAVRAVMRIVAENGIERMNLVALVGNGE
ncbi:MAG: biopolymer transporter ExbD [Planctomycetota bacterium]